MRMKLIILASTLCLSIEAQGQVKIPPAQPGQQYGKAITSDGAITIKKLETHMESDTAYMGKIIAKVVNVCEKKGCFIELRRNGDKDPIMVRFKDYGFFMPQDIVGRTVVLEGHAVVQDTSVATLKHYAEDKGETAREIAQITKSKEDISIIAEGVVVVK